jgi:hypothetical protein
MDKEVRVILRRVILDVVIVGAGKSHTFHIPSIVSCDTAAFCVAVGLPLLIFKLWGQPYKRGFFCNDESISHPFRDSTVTSEMLYVTGFAIPIAIVNIYPIDWRPRAVRINFIFSL